MYGNNSEEGYRKIIEGIEIKTISYGKLMLMTEFRLKKGALLPEHSHPQEQSGYLVKGHLTLYIGESARKLKPGDSWSIPGGTPHRAEISEDAVAVEVFSPVREDYCQYIWENDIIS